MATVPDLEITGLVAGGDGMGRDADGRVVFVPGALPGERVGVELVEEKQRFARGRLLDVRTPSPDRVAPPCRFVDEGCGGCDLQHATPGAQRAAKIEIVRDGLRRLGRIDVDAVELRPGPELATEGFRTTVRVAVRDGRAGFRMRHSHDVVTVDDCLVAHPLADELLRASFGSADEATIRVGAATGERLVVVEPTAHGVALPDEVTVIGADDLERGRTAVLHEEVRGRRYRISARSFFQSRHDGAEALVAEVLEAGGAELAKAGTVADLYGGVGLFASQVGALPSAPRVVLVERSRTACGDARVNLDGLDAAVQHRPVERWRPLAVDVTVADPSRDGLGRAGVDVVAGTEASVVVLVSCDAAALGRDAGLLAEADYRLEHATLVDLFPHTHHVEVVSRFTRTASRPRPR